MSNWLVQLGTDPAKALLRLMADGIVESTASATINAFSRSFHQLQYGKAMFGVVGVGGAGKSSFAKVISGQSALHQLPVAYESDLTEERSEFKDTQFLQLLTIAGQDTLATRGHRSIGKELKKLKRLVLVNIVSFGHSAPPRTMTRSQFERFSGMEGRKLEDQAADYFQKQRVQEEMHLAQLARALSAEADAARATRAIFLTVILKQDLWWDERDDVYRHYTASDGNYVKAVESVGNVFGGFEMAEVVSLALHPLNLILADGAVLKQTCSGYDRRAVELNWINTVSRFEELRQWASKG